jgi:rhodanese-related sulfurtransferase
MKKGIFIGLIALILIIVVGIFFVTNAKTDNSSKVTKSKGVTTSATEINTIEKDLKSGAILIDVRTPEEYSLERAKGAVNLPLSDIQSGVVPNTSKDSTIYLYCRSGRRATEAKAILEKQGYTKVVNLLSLDNWKSLGGSTTKAN